MSAAAEVLVVWAVSLRAAASARDGNAPPTEEEVVETAALHHCESGARRPELGKTWPPAGKEREIEVEKGREGGRAFAAA